MVVIYYLEEAIRSYQGTTVTSISFIISYLVTVIAFEDVRVSSTVLPYFPHV
jgi:hypothetical protein